MLIPVLHYEGNCADAIALYEKAFNTKTKDLIIVKIIKFVILKWLFMSRRFI